MKHPNLLIAAGALLYVLFSAYDRFVSPLPDWGMIPVAAVGAALVIWGLAASRTRRNHDDEDR